MRPAQHRHQDDDEIERPVTDMGSDLLPARVSAGSAGVGLMARQIRRITVSSRMT